MRPGNTMVSPIEQTRLHKSTTKSMLPINRSITNRINWAIDNLLPPILRDNRLFFSLLFWPIVGQKIKHFIDFKENCWNLSEKQFAQVYRNTALSVSRPTDVGTRGLKKLQELSGRQILEVGSGRGFVAEMLARQNEVTACDIVIDDRLRASGLPCKQAFVEDLPFTDNAFDLVLCTHILEHVLNFEKAISELRRVARNQIIIIVPLQRPNRYTPDLHVNFFPYPHDFLIRTRPANYEYEILDGDLYFVESLTETQSATSIDRK